MLEKLMALTISFGKIGIFSLGGGNSMLLLIEEECVKRNHWLTVDAYSSMIGISFLFPGLTAIKVSGAIGYNVAGVAGMVVSILALNLPGLLMMLALYTLLMSYQKVPLVSKTLNAMQYAAAVMLASVLVSFVMGAVKAYHSVTAIVISTLFFVILTFFNWNAFLSLMAFLGLFIVLG